MKYENMVEMKDYTECFTFLWRATVAIQAHTGETGCAHCTELLNALREYLLRGGDLTNAQRRAILKELPKAS